MAMNETADPNAGGDWWTTNAPPPPPAAPAAADDGADAWAQQYMTDHKIPDSWGTAANLVETYRKQLAAGLTPDQAKLAAPTSLGWAQAPTATNNPEPTPNPNPVTTQPVGGAAPGIGVPTSGFGSAPAPYVSNPNAPVYTPLPTYQAPTWTGGDYVNPTEADLLASPGYQSRLDASLQARNRSAAAQGTVLNGGTLKALDRTAQDYASNEYQTLRSNTFDAYKQRYSQFTDAAGMDLNARTINANENNNTFANRTATYNTANTRSLSDYITNVTNNRNAELDYWNRLQDVNQTGANLAGGSR
jgi:hypothetical protein